MSCKPSSTGAAYELQTQQHTSYFRAASPAAHDLLKSCTGAAYELQAQHHRSCL